MSAPTADEVRQVLAASRALLPDCSRGCGRHAPVKDVHGRPVCTTCIDQPKPGPDSMVVKFDQVGGAA